MNRKLAFKILKAILVLCTDEAVVETIWMNDDPIGTTVCEHLADIASELGATDEEIETVFMDLALPPMTTN